MNAYIDNAYIEDLKHLGEYTRVLKKRLPAACFRPAPRRLLWMLPHLIVITAGIFAIAGYSFHWLINLAISVAISCSFACLGFLGHEVLHGSVVRTPWLRSLAGQICMAPFWIGPRLWRRWHNLEHHGHTQDHEEDPDAMGTLEDFHRRPALRYLYRIAPWLRAVLMMFSFTFWFTMHSFKILVGRLIEAAPKERLLYLVQFLLPLGGWVALGAWLGWPEFAFAYLIPLALANAQVMSYIATNHLLNPLTPVNDPLANSLSVTTPRWVDMLHFNFSHHTEHHLFPAMNPAYAPRVKALCKQLWPDRYHEMPHWKAVLMVCLTPRVYYRYTRLVDPVRKLAYPVVGHGLGERRRLQPEPVAGLGEPKSGPVRLVKGRAREADS